tara:strand:+ start:426 stop:785 length:360 start_codon:yes stop_codon:yes gene_type:complete
MSIVAVGNTVRLQPAGATTANVGNVSTRTTTFHVLNASSTVYCYIGVFADYTTAAAMDYPAPGTDGGGIPLAPNESMTVTGNFGSTSTSDTVYVSAITATGAFATNVFFTPVAPGSSAN